MSGLLPCLQFDVIMMDPPWQLATANPTRGVALGYSQLTDANIQQLPVNKLQDAGLLFIWVINAKYKFAVDLFKQWGYRFVCLCGRSFGSSRQGCEGRGSSGGAIGLSVSVAVLFTHQDKTVGGIF